MGLKTLIYHWAEKEKKHEAHPEMHIRRATNYERIPGCQVRQKVLCTRGILQLFTFPYYLPKA